MKTKVLTAEQQLAILDLMSEGWSTAHINAHIDTINKDSTTEITE